MAYVLTASGSIMLVWFLIIIGVSLSYLYSTVCSASITSTPHDEYVSFSLTHRDAENSPVRSVEADLPADMPMRTFVAAGIALRRRVKSQKKSQLEAEKPLMRKLSYGGEMTGDFYLTIPVGTPSQNMIFLVDTGSEFTWTQCSPCFNCTNTTAPRFAYKQSSSFLAVGCDSELCVNSVGLTRLTTSCVNISSAAPSCLFVVSYLDKSFDAGVISVDSFHLGPAFSKPFVFGCATIVQDTAASPSSGLMGLDAGPFSFTSQLFAGHPDMPKKFAYCLPDRITSLNVPGRIEFGNYKPPAKVRYTPLAPPYAPLGSLFYYVKLEGISVGDTLIKVHMMEAERGTVIDSGASLTHLVKPVYDKMVREMKRQSAHLGPFNVTGDDGSSDLCYKAPVNAKKPPKVPRIRMHFAGGAELELEPGSILAAAYMDNASTVFCLAFQISANKQNIIGNYQQQNYWVEYNLEKSSLGLGKAKCTSYK